ncbi:GAF domain-containing protein [Arthrobacter sp. ISL-30]|uniref:GAF domain-containing sensor histidine kinase n=1 Tax=Arthrobacter sp. ISL-30 TaxID=2819109 RepID=UPI0027E1B048|nr:GAF domain-containing protein [Arthrobacter sp. ISL-30]
MNEAQEGFLDPESSAGTGLRVEELLREFVSRAGELLHAQERMRGLLEAVVAVAEDLSLEAVLERVVESACRLLHARYGALGVIGHDGALSTFITIGIEDDLAKKIGPLPTGHGVLGLLISDPKPLRLPDLRQHPESYGFPGNHPPMVSFLGVPVRVRGRVFGNLYLTEKEGGADFTPEDEELAVALAAAAGVAIENARLYEEARRRASWLEACTDVSARMMGNEQRFEAEGLDLIAGRARREAAADLALMVMPDADSRAYVVGGADGGASAEYSGKVVALDPQMLDEVVLKGTIVSETPIPAVAELTGRDSGPMLAIALGTETPTAGVLFLLRSPKATPYSQIDADMGSVFGSHVALTLELARVHRLREQLLVFTDRDRIAKDLHDVVIQRLFAAGLSVQSLGRFTNDELARDRIRTITRELDETIRELRDTIYSLRASSGESELLSSRIVQVVRIASRSLPFTPHVRLSGNIDGVQSIDLIMNVLAVLSEGLSNAIRHAGPSAIDVDVAVVDHSLTVRIEDDGSGFDPAERSGQGNGLDNMSRRAADLGGTFSIRSAVGLGSVLEWTVPLP